MIALSGFQLTVLRGRYAGLVFWDDFLLIFAWPVFRRVLAQQFEAESGGHSVRNVRVNWVGYVRKVLSDGRWRRGELLVNKRHGTARAIALFSRRRPDR